MSRPVTTAKTPVARLAGSTSMWDDAGVGVRAADKVRVQHPRHDDVIEVTAAPVYELDGVGPLHTAAKQAPLLFGFHRVNLERNAVAGQLFANHFVLANVG